MVTMVPMIHVTSYHVVCKLESDLLRILPIFGWSGKFFLDFTTKKITTWENVLDELAHRRVRNVLVEVCRKYNKVWGIVEVDAILWD